MSRSTTLGVALLVGAGMLFAGAAYLNSSQRNVPIVFSQPAMLGELWNTYKLSYLEPSSGRTLDKQRDNITTSEGQSYTMLRAVWQDDKATYDSSLKWATDNLKRTDDSLFAWRFGKLADGSYGIQTDQGGENTASDADSDIALSLIFAGDRWGQQSYTTQAKTILNDIWSKEVVIINGKPYLTADNLEKESDGPTAVINPSYFAPYAYRVFAQVDPSHDWAGLIDTSYGILATSGAANLDKNSSIGLPPDWLLINKQTGELSAPTGSSLDTNYGYDALRIPWRLALDYQWNKEPRASQVLSQFKFLSTQWSKNGSLMAGYTHDGSALSNDEVPAFYGGAIGYFMVSDSTRAQAVYNDKLKSLYDPNTQGWKKSLSYYDDNWTWFGLALYSKSLVNLHDTP